MVTKFDMLVLSGFVALCSFVGIMAEDCEDPKTVKNFDASQYMGTWYQNRLFNFKPSMKCIKHTWIAAPSGEIQFRSTSFHIEGNQIENVSGKILIQNPSEPGKVTLSTATDTITRMILGSDYTSFSVEYDCPLTTNPLRILTREPNPPQSVIEKALRVIREHAFPTGNYIMTDQSCWNQKSTTPKGRSSSPNQMLGIEINISV